jgi:ubiquinone/menaquinone biosynthesis C-methylase UbiE
MKKDTSWGNVADWYSEHLDTNSDSYQSKVVLPNLLRLVSPKKGEQILDLACGEGFFARELSKAGVKVLGVDVSPELISIAQNKSKDILYKVSASHELRFVETETVDKIINILAIQNIENISSMLSECARLLKPQGRMFIVMNHPSFRIPKKSSWGWDEKEKVSYRRIDAYLSEYKSEILMNPGSSSSEKTISFHRPLQYYFKAFEKSKFAVTRLEEWISHKKSEVGPRQKEEDRMRKEIPLFACFELVKIS